MKPSVIARAKRASEKMATATDSLNASIRGAEEFLLSLGLGVTESVPFQIPSDEVTWKRYLRFGKYQDKWQLTVLSGPEDGELEEAPLLSCSRRIRIESVDYLPALMDALVTGAEIEADQIARVAATMVGLLP